jgi:hypothetical protein
LEKEISSMPRSAHMENMPRTAHVESTPSEDDRLSVSSSASSSRASDHSEGPRKHSEGPRKPARLYETSPPHSQSATPPASYRVEDSATPPAVTYRKAGGELRYPRQNGTSSNSSSFSGNWNTKRLGVFVYVLERQKKIPAFSRRFPLFLFP